MKLRLTVPASKAESLLSPKMQETGPREQGIPEAATCIIGPQKHLGKLFQSFPLHNIKSNIVGVEIIQNQNEIKIFSIECIKLVTYFNYCSILVSCMYTLYFSQLLPSGGSMQFLHTPPLQEHSCSHSA